MTKTKDISPFIMLDDANSSLPLYLQIYEKIREEILIGELSSGVKLPATRMLATNLGVSRITVTNAYEQLFAEGYLEGKTGSGTFVASELPEDFLQTSHFQQSKTKQNKLHSKIKLSEFGENLKRVSEKNADSQFTSSCVPFQRGLPAINDFPIETWIKIERKIQKNLPKDVLGYGNAAGYKKLRESVALHLESARGVKCSPEQIIITNGVQQGIDLITRILINKKDKVWMENPCYLGARNRFVAQGMSLEYLPIDGEGLDFVEARKRKEKPKLIYVTPSHQFPLGITMSLNRRLNLLEFAEENNAWIIEDDYNSEYRFSGRPIASLQGLDRAGSVIYLGTFSKTIFPALRLGCIVVPEELIETFTKAKALTDRHSPIFEQMVLAEFIDENHYVRHIRRMRKLYAERREIMIDALNQNIGKQITIQPSSAGLHLTIWLDEKLADTEISQKLLDKGIYSEALSNFVFGQELPPAVILGYAAFDKKQIKKGIQELATILG